MNDITQSPLEGKELIYNSADQHPFNVLLPKDLYNRLREASFVENVRMAEIIRRALISYFENYGKA